MRWYGVYGQNGGGIYTKWDAVLNNKPYVSGFRVKKFKTYAEARSYIIAGIKEIFPVSQINEDTFQRINWFYYS